MTIRDWIDPFRVYDGSTPARRLMYLWGVIVFPVVVLIFVSAIALTIDFVVGNNAENSLINVAWIGWYVFYLVAGLIVSGRRLKDLGRPGSDVILLFLPLVNIVLGFQLLFKLGISHGDSEKVPSILGSPRDRHYNESNTLLEHYAGPAQREKANPFDRNIETPASKFCFKCGEKLPSGSVYCPSCGVQIP